MADPKILVIDDEVDICRLITDYLKKNGFQTAIALSGVKALELLEKENFDVILSDFRLTDLDGLELLIRTKDIRPHVPVIILTGYSDVRTAVQTIKHGAYDYITKPPYPEELLLVINKALQESQDKKENKTPAVSNFIMGESEQMKEVFRLIDLVGPTRYSVLIQGESGTGKESVAQTIHNRSIRKDGPFIAVDCGTLSRDLAMSELFGHERGSFTGAIQSKAGFFEMADEGTLFLDEIGNLPLDVQMTLLRVIQERCQKRVGGTKEIQIDVRLICATNDNLLERVKSGLFRQDLYYRINEFGINLAPLRERPKDIMAFAEHFLQQANHEQNKWIRGFSGEVIDTFLSYSWPGNIRELKNVVRKAALVTAGAQVESYAIPKEIVQESKVARPMAASTAQGMETDLRKKARQAELEVIHKVLQQVNFNRTKAAKILNIDRKTLYNKMKQLGNQN